MEQRTKKKGKKEKLRHFCLIFNHCVIQISCVRQHNSMLRREARAGKKLYQTPGASKSDKKALIGNISNGRKRSLSRKTPI